LAAERGPAGAASVKAPVGNFKDNRISVIETDLMLHAQAYRREFTQSGVSTSTAVRFIPA
jgi:hypothetical protein